MAAIIIVIFAAGYLFIAFETQVRLNKAAIALLTGVLCWTVYILFSDDKELVGTQLSHHLGEISQILFFLLGAMAIVELIDAHDGFEIITSRIKTTNKQKLVWIVAILAFFLSAVLDNLTTAIVLVTMIRRIASDTKDRWMLSGVVIIAANAGGVWSPIGDVTTTMLWIGGQVTAFGVIAKLFLPGLVCILVPLFLLRFVFKGDVVRPSQLIDADRVTGRVNLQRNIIFASGVIILLMVPVFKTVTHLPPFMGILIGLGVMWIITEVIHSDKDEEDRQNFTVAYALQKIDTPGILFFLGILLAVGALESTGQLLLLAGWMDNKLQNHDLIAMTLGLSSSVVDNVPLIAATQGMYQLDQYPTDHYFWEFLAYATGTGGSILIIGSAAGVAAMGLEKIDFVWYLKKISWLALAGYLCGAIIYILQNRFFN
ncbi:MAG: sodium:proton antiporter [Bacteroidetes bacterium]|jgi:NhaD family Na+/H+ antiporter|nr:MAG: sodium:proton antiporter [Bacteroidota bacterium]